MKPYQICEPSATFTIYLSGAHVASGPFCCLARIVILVPSLHFAVEPANMALVQNETPSTSTFLGVFVVRCC